VRSWNSSTEKVARPCLAPVSPRSCSTCSATAVELNARPMPMMTAGGTASPHATAHAVPSPALSTICAEPMPKMYLDMEMRRSYDSSRPMCSGAS